MNFHSKNVDEVFNGLGLSEYDRNSGLNEAQVKERLAKYGKNALQEAEKKSLVRKIWDMIKDPMILILIAAALLSGAMGELIDSIIILIVVILNTVIGLVQESKAEEAIEALKKMSAQHAKVIRNAKVMEIDVSEIVPGDIVTLDAGDLVPADMRLLETSSLKIEEASLTGESVPSEKDSRAEVADDAPLGDRKNMAYYGTGVTYGRAKGIVTNTGMTTEMGKIASLINATEDNQTPLQKKLKEIGNFLTVAVLVICAIIFATIMIKNGKFEVHLALDAFMVSVSLAVAAIPESLPAVVTIVMAIGVTVMAKRNAIIRKLPAVETLGCAEVICSDKTGTLTQNKMDVRELYMQGKSYTAESFTNTVDDKLLYNILYLCNDSEINEDGTEIGDPTETCLKRFTLKKFARNSFSTNLRLSDLPFDSDRKMMSTVNKTGNEGLPEAVFTKGAPDEVLKICDKILVNGEVSEITEQNRSEIMSANKGMADKALRVLGMAYKPFAKGEELEEGLIFAGLVGMIDPPRPEAKDAIERCKHAGITTIMITGDHKDTAVAIASELGLIDDPSQAVFGSILDDMTDEQLVKAIPGIRVYARVSPQHKVRIVKAWQSLGKVVAMTGDGVNDAPALKIADIGIGMGITGTDVSKGVSDMLLQDDNFATIVNAVEEGRKIYTNIRKSVQFLLSSNMSEVMSLFIATLFLPAGTVFLSAVHILWINLVTDSIPAIGLGLNSGEKGVMEKPPRDSRASIFSGGVGIGIIYQGAIMTALTLLAYYEGSLDTPVAATTMAFVTLSSAQIFHSFNIKAGNFSSFSKKTFDNRTMILGAIVPFSLTVMIINVPFLAEVFKVQKLTLIEWVWCVGLAFMIIPIEEVFKIFKRR